MVNTIITLAHSLNTKAIANGIETKLQLQTLQALSCKFARGYLFAEPPDVTEVKVILENLAKRNYLCS